jgi:hypothetical protein
MLKASALKVVDITDIPAIPGTITCRSRRRLCSSAPKKPRNSSGSRKLKNAALGLRQNILRSSRYWRQASPLQRRADAPSTAARSARPRSIACSFIRRQPPP